MNVCNIALIFFAGTYFMEWKNFGNFFKKGFNGILFGCPVAYFATVGFDSAACYTKETKDANKNVPLAIVSSLLCAAFTYILLSLVLTGMADISEIPNEDILQGIAWAFQ